MNKLEKLSLSKFLDGIEITDKVCDELVGTVIKDEDGFEQGKIVSVDKEYDVIFCELYGDLADKIRRNYSLISSFEIVDNRQ